MHPSQRARLHQQKRVKAQAENSDTYAFFNLLTGPEFLDHVESLLPDHRERLFPPTETLSMFLAQAMRVRIALVRASWMMRQSSD